MTTEMLVLAVLVLSGTQAAVMGVDELWYHRRRRLSLLEASGHCLDSAVFLVTLLVATTSPPTPESTMLYALLAVASTILVTKDEGIHAQHCGPGEQWLHSLLFVLHAPLLIAFGMLWHADPTAWPLRAFPWTVGFVLVYQIAYWGYFHVFGQQRFLRRAGRPVV